MCNRIPSSSCVYSMSKDNEPVAIVQHGSTITFETHDAFGWQATSAEQRIHALDWSRVNPARGPVT